VTENVGFENYTFTNLELTSSLYPRLGNLEKLSDSSDSIPRLYLIFNHTVLFVKMEVTLTNIIEWSSRRNKHHDLEIPLLTFIGGVSSVYLFWVV
tara:strand:- start:532 stop:816 length:285 start_codon:yes stop_codon:yes gene_type:complete